MNTSIRKRRRDRHLHKAKDQYNSNPSSKALSFWLEILKDCITEDSKLTLQQITQKPKTVARFCCGNTCILGSKKNQVQISK